MGFKQILMLRQLTEPLRLILTWMAYLLLFIAAKPLFMLANAEVYSSVTFSEVMSVLAHGFRMDSAMAAYLTAVPSLLTLVFMFAGNDKVRKWVFRTWFALTAIVLGLVYVADAVLYGYWGFKLDTTPIFYFTTSPSAALASATPAELAGGLVCWIILTVAFYAPLAWLYSIPLKQAGDSVWRRAAVTFLLTALLFIPIRGGVTVSTLNLSSAFFSQKQELNHAAINPAFSLLNSAAHPDNLDGVRFMDDDEAAHIFAGMDNGGCNADTTILADSRPDIYLIILESFSNRLFPSLGGEDIAVGLDSVGRSGMMWTQFFATTFRTDRAIPAILGGMPSPPGFSVLKDVGVASRISSLPRKLRDAGYSLSYYYGGDVNFTNMLAYLVNSGFENVVRDTDFPVSQRLSKWGVHDGPLLDRAYAGISSRADAGSVPEFVVVQTSSSHEPFDVPADFARCAGKHKAANSFAYADSCVTAFVNRLNALPSARPKLIILVPDHYNAYPRDLKDPVARHSIPLIFTGDAVAVSPRLMPGYASQADIAPTLLSLLGIPYTRSEFPFGGNMFDSRRNGRAVFFDKGVFALIDSTAMEIVNVNSPGPESENKRAKAYLQTLCSTLSKIKKQK